MARCSAQIDCLNVDGNNGGSYVMITRADQDGFCHLEVGETCVRTIKCVMSVTALAAILTHCRDVGFAEILKQYDEKGGGSPTFSIDHDPISGKWQGGP